MQECFPGCEHWIGLLHLELRRHSIYRVAFKPQTAPPALPATPKAKLPLLYCREGGAASPASLGGSSLGGWAERPSVVRAWVVATNFRNSKIFMFQEPKCQLLSKLL